MADILHLTTAAFDQTTAKGTWLIGFWATWCGPCRVQAKLLDDGADAIAATGANIAKVNIDDEATLSAPELTIKSEANNYVTNIALAYQSKLKSYGFAAGIDVLNFENTALVADFDEAFSDDTSIEVPAAYIAADSIDVGAFTHAHVNTIAAAGSGACLSRTRQKRPRASTVRATVRSS